MSSLSSHINELLTFLNLFEIKFDKICITESRFSQKICSQARSISLVIMLNMPQQRHLLVGGCLMFISQTLQYIVRKDLQIYFPKQLESVFIEPIISKQAMFCNRYNLQIPQHPKLNI